MSQRLCEALADTVGVTPAVPFIIAWLSPYMQKDRRQAYRRESWTSIQAERDHNKPVFPHQCATTSTFMLGNVVINHEMGEVKRDFLTTPELKKAAEVLAKAWSTFVTKTERESSKKMTSRLYEDLNNR